MKFYSLYLKPVKCIVVAMVFFLMISVTASAVNYTDPSHQNDAARSTPQGDTQSTAPQDVAQSTPDGVAQSTPHGVIKQSPQKGKAEAKQGAERFVSIDFNDVDISVFIKFISELTGKNFVVDDKVKGKVTIISPAKISEKEAYKVFESVLEVHGYSTVKSGEIIKVIATPDARTKNIETLLKIKQEGGSDKIVTQLIPLKYADVSEIKRLFAPLVSKNSVVLAYPQTNMLIITDIYSNIQRLMRILSAIDVTGIGQEVTVIPLQSADATKLVKILETVFMSKSGRRRKGDSDLEIKFVADERTNAVVLFASELDTFRVKKLIRLLDKKTPKGKEKIHVYYLENAVAEEMAKVLQMLPSKTTTAVKGKQQTAPVVSGETKITADKSTNSLIIMADKDDYMTLEEVIKKLDIPRAMVYIECLLMEVNVSNGFGLGLEWTANNEIGDQEGAYGAGFVPNNSTLVDMVQGAATTGGIVTYPAGGLTMGVMGKTITAEIAGEELSFPTLTSFITALKTDKNVNILSTPQIITTDNQEAKITVGSNTPFITKVGESDTSGLYTNYEYKDVGITLKVTPQISKDRLVRLNIFQEITSIDQAATQQLGLDKPSTLKRTIETTVIVKDKNTVVIGGLIGNQFSHTESKVPFFGDIPLIGLLFKSMSKGSDKTNLYFFLTPHVVGSPIEAEEKYLQKKAEIERIMGQEDVKGGKVKMYRWLKTNPETISTGGVKEMPDNGAALDKETEGEGVSGE